jgi:hypothetical protein
MQMRAANGRDAQGVGRLIIPPRRYKGQENGPLTFVYRYGCAKLRYITSKNAARCSKSR